MAGKKKTSPKTKGDDKETERLESNRQKIEVEETSRPSPDDEGAPEEAAVERASAAEVLSAEEMVEKLEAGKQEHYDRMLRVQADFDNYRKRVQKEQVNLLRYGAENALREILPIVDHMELAVDSARAHDNSDSQMREGFEMILNQFFSVLEKLGVKPIETVDRPFDPNIHDALLRVHAPDADEGTVVGEIRKGYYLHDKVLRPAQVTVGAREMAPAAEPETEESSEESE
jgi:molecular chaperone GrpE